MGNTTKWYTGDPIFRPGDLVVVIRDRLDLDEQWKFTRLKNPNQYVFEVSRAIYSNGYRPIITLKADLRTPWTSGAWDELPIKAHKIRSLTGLEKLIYG